MERFDSKTKTFVVLTQKKAFLIFSEMESCTLQPKLKK